MKLITIFLLFLVLVVKANAQNQDSLELDRYFKEGQRNFKYLKAMDSLKITFDSLKNKNSTIQKSIDGLMSFAYDVGENLKLYSFLLKVEKDGLESFRKDSSEFLIKEGKIIRLKFNRDANLENLKGLVGENEIQKQLPNLLSKIASGKIQIEEYANPRRGGGGIGGATGSGFGMSLPEWPKSNTSSIANKQILDLYKQQENYITKFCEKFECGKSYSGLFKKKQAEYKYPEQVGQLVNNQYLFKQFLDEKCKR